MSEAKPGDKVRVHYTGTLKDGTTFDSSKNRDPLEFELGAGTVIPGFESAVTGMSTGETKTAQISAADAYGEHRDEMVMEVERQHIPSEIDVSVGQRLQLKTPEGKSAAATVTAVSESSVTLDANHPLAGKDLSFEIELLEIVPA